MTLASSGKPFGVRRSTPSLSSLFIYGRLTSMRCANSVALQAIGADDRKRDKMPDTGADLGGGQVPARGLEEVHRD
jgi:hypothetical protein